MQSVPVKDNSACHACGTPGMRPFYQIHDIPVHSCILLDRRDHALAFPKGDLRLAFCDHCGFIQNTLFDISHNKYSTAYEETQGFSPTFNKYAAGLATRLVKTYNLHNSRVMEIGCGKGDFLVYLCERGPNTGVGFDPAFVPERQTSEAAHRIEFIQDLYSEKYSHIGADFVCCRHTLEHIPNTLEFLQMIRRSIGDRLDTTVFFDVPDIRRVLSELAFWDIYYEHCSYFGLGSLARIFRMAGFEILHVGREYDDQYLVIETRPRRAGEFGTVFNEEDDLAELNYYVETFRKTITRQTNDWREKLESMHRSGRKTVLWGSGSKATAFLTTLGVTDEIEYVVDINPYKHDMYLAGTGHKIVSPGFLRSYQPDLVIAMNPIYCNEIRADLDRLGVHADLTDITNTRLVKSHA